MKQVLFGQPLSAVTAVTAYGSIMGTAHGWANEGDVRSPWPAPGRFRNLIVELEHAPGAGASRTFTLRKAGTNTALTLTISDTATTARLTGIDVTVAVGDLVAIQNTVTGSPVSTAVRWSLEFEGTTAKESSYSGTLGGCSEAFGTRGAGVFLFHAPLTNTTPADSRQVVAAAGRLTSLIAAKTAVAGSGGMVFYINHNGVRQDGSGGTVNTTCTLTSGTSASAVFTLPLSAGDLVYIEAVPSGAFFHTWSLGTSFVAATDGQSQLCGVGQDLNAIETLFGQIPSQFSVLYINEPVFLSRNIGGISSIRLSRMRVFVSAAPGAGASYTITLRANAASLAPTVTISDTATTGSDLIHIGTIGNGAQWNMRVVPTNTPAVVSVHWSFIQQTLATTSLARRMFTTGGTTGPLSWMELVLKTDAE